MAKSAIRTHILRAQLRLRELILSGEFAPGERMSELPLVERLGVSRTPLRLALAELEHEGLLRTLTRGGYAVREFTQDDIRDAIERREGARADALGREHARLSLVNLEIVLRHRGVMARMPGATLLALDVKGHTPTVSTG